MPPHAPCPLDQRGHRGEIRHHDVEIEIERGFEHLSPDDDRTRPVAPALAGAGEDFGLDPLAVRQREPRVKQDCFDPGLA
jgi:hypothetical protein